MATTAYSVSSGARDPGTAAGELAAAFPEPLDLLLFFCAADCDLPGLGAALKQQFSCPIVGCTAAGQIGTEGYQHAVITALGISGGRLRARPQLFSPLADCQTQAMQLAAGLTESESAAARQGRLFGLLLVDGLSMMEEWLCGALYQALPHVPLVGGSAGDDNRFVATHVYFDGAFHRDAAVFTLFDADCAFHTFELHHFAPTPHKLVITQADPGRRIIHEINGEPAAIAYANAIGLRVEELSDAAYAQHPLMLRLEQKYYVRSISGALPDHSLQCFCAIDAGLVLTIGQATDGLAALERAFAELRGHIAKPVVVLGCDCTLRRLGFEQSGECDRIGRFLAEQKVFGFNTYGEQYNSIHANQTFTAIALGA